MRPWVLLMLLVIPMLVVGQEVQFSHEGGFYAEPFSLSLSGSGTNTIRYTLNGSEPTAIAEKYTEPIAMTERAFSHSDIFRLQNAAPEFWYAPDTVEHIIVVRAALFDDARQRVGPVATQSYIIGSLLGRNIGLPVVSLCVDSADLFDYDSGIFVPGRHYDPADPNSHRTGNYYMRGREWERTAHFAYFEGGMQRVGQTCGVRIHGISQRNKPQKAMTLYAREEYGKKKFEYPFFGNRPSKKYKRLVLRSFQATRPYTSDGVHDWLCQRLADPLKCDNLASRPVVLFLNGEYWGIYFLEEKPDEHYIERLYGIDDENVTVVENWYLAENGDQQRWDDFHSRLLTIDATCAADSAWLAGEVDIDAFIDYMLLELFIANADWPANNVRCWASEGRLWRFVFYDGDYTLDDRWFDRYANLVCDDTTVSYPTSPHATLLMRRLLENPTWRRRSAERLQVLAGSYLSYGRCKDLLEEISTLLEPELAAQVARFNTPTSEKEWRDDLELADDYLMRNAFRITEDYLAFLGLGAETLTVDSTRLKVMPNPTVGDALLLIRSEWGRDCTVTIYNAVGEVQRTFGHVLHPGTNIIRLPHMAPGAYYIKVDGFPRGVRWVTVK